MMIEAQTVGITLGVIFAVLLLLYLSHVLWNPRNLGSYADRVVAITGGSSGIGKATAKQVLDEGGKVALIARKQAQLDETREELLGEDPDQRRVSVHTGDVNDGARMTTVMREIFEHHGRFDVIVTSAGVSEPAEFHHISEKTYRHVLDVNIVGTRNAIYAALPYLAKGDKGRIAMVSSLGGLWGFFGFTAYSASKFALLGMGQALEQEMRAHGIHVTISFPADVDTPLLAKENEKKPELCKILTEAGGLWTPQQVASSLLGAVREGNFLAGSGIDSFLLRILGGGAAPVRSTWQAVLYVLTAPLAHLICYAYQLYFNHTIDSYYKKHPVPNLENPDTSELAEPETGTQPNELRRRTSQQDSKNADS